MSHALAAPKSDVLARDLAAVLRPSLATMWGHRLVERALAHADQSLPAPPLLAWRAARVLGVRGAMARRWMLGCALFYGAADLMDDAEDGDLPDVDPGVARAAALEVLFVSLSVLSKLRPGREAPLHRFLAEGARMASGQLADLEFTGQLSVAVPAIAREKSGSEFAAFLGGAADLAGAPPRAWARFGRALGEVLQIVSDFDDLITHDARDLAAARPSAALRPPGLDAAARYRAHARAIGGRRSAQFARAHLWSGRGDERLAEALAPSLAALQEQAAHPFLEALSGHVHALVRQRKAMLRGGDPRAAHTVPLATAMRPVLAAAASFLDDAVSSGALDEVCRHGLFGAPEVRGDIFGPLFLSSLRVESAALRVAIHGALRRHDADGWRYYPGRDEIPPDADDNGLALQAWAGLDAQARALASPDAVARAAELLRRNRRADGLFWTWMAPTPTERASIATRWAGERCLVSSAQALLGLWRATTASDQDEALRGLQTLCAALRDAPPPSAFYPPTCVDALALPIALELAADLAVADAPWCVAAREATVRRICARRRSDSSFGTTLETALAARALVCAAARVEAPEAIALALIAAQAADGGFPADPLFATVPHAVTRTYGSRALTTGAVLAALEALRTVAGSAEVPGADVPAGVAPSPPVDAA
ncbi:MAG: hypothetical protein U0325_17275 [Polyangiales bacterium]